MRNRVAVALTATIAATAAVAPPAHAATAVAQGAQIVVADSSSCAVAFNDHAEHISYTSAHCGLSGDRVRVKLVDGTLTPEIGTLYPSSCLLYTSPSPRD